MWNFKKDTSKLVCKTEIDSHRKQAYGYRRGDFGQGINEEFGTSRHTPLYKTGKQQIPSLCSTGSYA